MTKQRRPGDGEAAGEASGRPARGHPGRKRGRAGPARPGARPRRARRGAAEPANVWPTPCWFCRAGRIARPSCPSTACCTRWSPRRRQLSAEAAAAQRGVRVRCRPLASSPQQARIRHRAPTTATVCCASDLPNLATLRARRHPPDRENLGQVKTVCPDDGLRRVRRGLAIGRSSRAAAPESGYLGWRPSLPVPDGRRPLGRRSRATAACGQRASARCSTGRRRHPARARLVVGAGLAVAGGRAGAPGAAAPAQLGQPVRPFRLSARQRRRVAGHRVQRRHPVRRSRGLRPRAGDCASVPRRPPLARASGRVGWCRCYATADPIACPPGASGGRGVVAQLDRRHGPGDLAGLAARSGGPAGARGRRERTWPRGRVASRCAASRSTRCTASTRLSDCTATRSSPACARRRSTASCSP